MKKILLVQLLLINAFFAFAAHADEWRDGGWGVNFPHQKEYSLSERAAKAGVTPYDYAFPGQNTRMLSAPGPGVLIQRSDTAIGAIMHAPSISAPTPAARAVITPSDAARFLALKESLQKENSSYKPIESSSTAESSELRLEPPESRVPSSSDVGFKKTNEETNAQTGGYCETETLKCPLLHATPVNKPCSCSGHRGHVL